MALPNPRGVPTGEVISDPERANAARHPAFGATALPACGVPIRRSIAGQVTVGVCGQPLTQHVGED
jgi:hypothetical protein